MSYIVKLPCGDNRFISKDLDFNDWVQCGKCKKMFRGREIFEKFTQVN